MDPQEHNSLIAEYNANVALWEHDDNLRQQRHNIFLAVNTILFFPLATLIGAKPGALYVAIFAIFLAVFGFLLAKMWNQVQMRNAEYIRFRRYQLMHIEHKLGAPTTFRNTFKAFYEGQDIEYSEPRKNFKLEKAATESSTLSEEDLPKLFSGLWVVVGVVGFLTVMIQILTVMIQIKSCAW